MRELAGSRTRIAEAAALERRALERDLHDGAQQQLTAILLRLSMARETCPDDSVTYAHLVKLEGELEGALEELRRLGQGIYPAPLAELGLVGALKAVARVSGGTIEVSGEGVGRHPSVIEAAVYFCCLEAVQNATKHATSQAQGHISIRLQEIRPVLRFEVHDDGPGFEPGAPHDGMGLRNMRDRLEALDGRLEIVSAPGRGTAVVGALPVV